ncbi:MAG: hypothetical protein AAFV93_09175 [Chloroflexota bacterium]
MEILNWLIPNRVLYWKLPNGSTTNDFHAGLMELQVILEQTEQQIHMVVDARMAQSLVGNTTLASRLGVKVAKNPQMGCCFVISHNFMFKHQLNRVTTAFGTHLRYSDSFRNAWQSLHNVDGSLPYVAPNIPVFNQRRIRKYA